jgi:hypothetical protein
MAAETPPKAESERIPRPQPAGLSVRADAFWDRSEADYDLTDSEAELLTEAAHTITEIDALKRTLELEGLSVLGSMGQSRVHPAVNEIRQHRMALARLLKAIDLPAEDDQPETQATKDARAAANSRWSMQRERSHRGSA